MRVLLWAACVLIIAVYAALINLKGIGTDEGLRMAIVNGNLPYGPGLPAPPPTWTMVMRTIDFTSYQPLYYLLLNSLMRLARSHDVVFFRAINLAFLLVALRGLVALSAQWRLPPRLFLLGLFSFNAYLFMHVLQVREYMAGVTFYVWSTWLVLYLEQRSMGRPWPDVAWFSVYGVVLALGFFLQTWVVFPAIGQGLFLVVRRHGDWFRFCAHLALSYFIVLFVAWPYLQGRRQLADVGHWGVEGASLWPSLSDGFHLVLAGHTAGSSRFSDFLPWFWLALGMGAPLLLLNRKHRTVPEVVDTRREYRRQGLLMFLCSAVSLAFQIGYALKIDNLSLWPRYFIIHYFFLTWLIALGFNYLWTLRGAVPQGTAARWGLSVALGWILTVLAFSACFQVHSFYRDPYLDTGLSAVSNWQSLAGEFVGLARPTDVLVFHDLTARGTFTFSRPVTNPAVLPVELDAGKLGPASRLIYLESSEPPAERDALTAQAAALGLKSRQVVPLHAPDGQSQLTDWRAVIFSRP